MNGIRRTPMPLLQVIAWLFVATLRLATLPLVTRPLVAQPVAAQVAPPPTNSLPASQSPLGDLTSLTGDAKIWLQDLIKINTTNPPGNEQAAAKYILAILQKEGIAAEELPCCLRPHFGCRAPSQLRGGRSVACADSRGPHGRRRRRSRQVDRRSLRGNCQRWLRLWPRRHRQQSHARRRISRPSLR